MHDIVTEGALASISLVDGRATSFLHVHSNVAVNHERQWGTCRGRMALQLDVVLPQPSA